MNVADVFDWSFMWSMFRNFAATGSPFVMIVVAFACLSMLLTTIVKVVYRNKS